jgi:flagellar basal body-associated protein FliL
MQWTRSARTTAIVAVLGVAVLFAGTAMAVTVADSEVPSESQVGNPVTASANLTDLYDEDDQWTLAVQTDLQDPQWTVEYLNQTGDVIETVTQSGDQALTGPTVSPPVDEISISVTGETPGVESFDYGSDQTYLGLQVEKRTSGGDETIENWQVTHYTEASRSAKQALDAASEAIDAAEESGGDVTEAQSDFDSAVQAYNGENPNFDLAQQLATDARDAAEAATNDGGDDGGLPLIPIVGGVVVLAVVVGGALYYYSQQNKQQSSRLQ